MKKERYLIFEYSDGRKYSHSVNDWVLTYVDLPMEKILELNIGESMTVKNVKITMSLSPVPKNEERL